MKMTKTQMMKSKDQLIDDFTTGIKDDQRGNVKKIMNIWSIICLKQIQRRKDFRIDESGFKSFWIKNSHIEQYIDKLRAENKTL